MAVDTAATLRARRSGASVGIAFAVAGALTVLGSASAGLGAFTAARPGCGVHHFLSHSARCVQAIDKEAPAGGSVDSGDAVSAGEGLRATTTAMVGVLSLGVFLGILSVAKRITRRHGRQPKGGPDSRCLLAGLSAPVNTQTPSQPSNRRTAVACNAAFEGFTAESMDVIMIAQREARSFGQEETGTEMLILGILGEGYDSGARALHAMGISIDQCRVAIEQFVTRGEEATEMLEMPFSTTAKQVLVDAIEFAKIDGCLHVHTVHILRAVLHKSEDNGAKLMGCMLGCETPQELVRRALPQIEKETLGLPSTALSRDEEDRSMHNSAKDSKSRTANASSASTSAASPVTPSSAAPDRSASPYEGVDAALYARYLAEKDPLQETLKYAQDLTKMAKEGKLEPLVGRELQLERTIRILGRRSKNNPVFVGEPGVGKTAIAHGLADRIARGKVPPTLRGKRVVELDLALLLAGTRYRGDFEERLRAVIQEVKDCNRQVILVIDEVHTLVGAGANGDSGGIDAANLLKPALARGELQCLGATTHDEYRKYIEKDPALERRFQPVLVPEPTPEEAEAILEGLAPKYEEHHHLRYTHEALKAAVQLSSQYISDRCLPDKAIDVMDEAGSKVRQQQYKAEEEQLMATNAERIALDEELQVVKEKKKEAVAAESYEDAHSLRAQESALEEKLEALRCGTSEHGPDKLTVLDQVRILKAQVQEAVAAEHYDEAAKLKAQVAEISASLPEVAAEGGESLSGTSDVQVMEQDIAAVVAGWTGIAVEQVSSAESSRLLSLEDNLHESVVGQHEAVQAVARSLRRARTGLRHPNRPIASFMFSGPTGVGKTQLCKSLAEQFFGAEGAMVRIDMSEFMEKHTVSKLLGAPPGYVGFDEGGVLTEAVRRKPYSLILFDEVEKAHPDVFNALLQLLDDGRLTDSKGRTVSFANSLIVLTSNLGSRAVQKGAAGGGGLGFGTAEDTEEANYDVVKELVHEEMKNFFRPEFLNRLDEMVVFRPLTKEDVRQISEIELDQVIQRLAKKDLYVSLTGKFKDFLVEQGFDPAYGARPLRRAITHLLEDKLAEYYLNNTAQQGASETMAVSVDVNNGVVEVKELSERVMISDTNF